MLNPNARAMDDKPRDAEVLAVYADEDAAARMGSPVVREGERGRVTAPASTITYEVVLHTPTGDVPFENVVPENRWQPDTIDTISAKPGQPVGVSWRGDEALFWMTEGVRIDEVCE